MHQNKQEQIKQSENKTLELCKQEVIAFTPEELVRIKESIDAIVNNNEKNVSILTKMANAWGPLSWWLKALIFVAIMIPTIIVAVLTQAIWIILAVAAINGFFALLYLGISLLLDNHFTRFTETKEELKAIMNAMADFLGHIIMNLQDIAHTFGCEVERFKVENGKLAVNVDEFTQQNQLLNHQVADLSGINVTIKENSEKLETTVFKQEELLQKQKQLQDDMHTEHMKQLLELQTQISALTQINDDLTKELDTAHLVAKNLMETNISLTAINTDFDKSREAFLGHSCGFFNEKNEKLNTVVDGFSNKVTYLQNTTDLFRQSIEEQKTLSTLAKENKIRFNNLSDVYSQDSRLNLYNVFKTSNPPVADDIENLGVLLN